MPNLPKGTVVAQGPCPACGAPGKYTVTKTGTVCMICTAPDEDLDPCNTRLFFGGKRSKKMQRDYLAARKKSKQQEDVTDGGSGRSAGVPDETPAPGNDDGRAGDGGVLGDYGF